MHSATIFRTRRVVSASLTRWKSTLPQSKRLDAFEVLNLERRFDVSQDALKQSYRSLMANLHPDKHHTKPPSEQETLREKASVVTQSYQILKNSPTRATHMLQLFGKVEDTDEASMRELFLGGSSQGQFNMLLMEVMEIREEIEETEDEGALQSLLEENITRMESVCNELADAFANQDLDSALELAVKLQYYNRIDETIREKKD